MKGMINAAFLRSRTVLLFLALILIAGAYSYATIPKESSPDIPIPVVHVSVAYQGISPTDAVRLLVTPLETELQALAGLDELEAVSTEGYVSVTLSFAAGYDPEEALDEVREAVDLARPELPPGAEDPVVQEVNVSLFPVLTVVLSGPVPERALVELANDLADEIEGLAGVLEVDIGGDREELLEVLIDPIVLETYDISLQSLINQIQRNNQLIAAGALTTGAGRLPLKVPGVIENIDDVLQLPVKVEDNTVVTFSDVATVRRTFVDPTGFARINGQPALALEVKKKVGANIIETVESVRKLIEQRQQDWPAAIRVDYLQDESEQVRTMLGDLQNNVIAAILLVMLVIVLTLGLRTSLLVGLAIPGAFLAGIVVINLLGYTLNIVVLFSLILVVGMLVDGAIVTTELADRRLAEGMPPKQAYASAAKRMAWPIIASTATTVAVFFPLLFWGGVVGEFMKFLPITVIITLTASLFMALIFIPVLGGWLGRPGGQSESQLRAIQAAESGDLDDIGGYTGAYVRLLERLIRRPLWALSGAILLLIVAIAAYAQFGRGVEFFPSIEPDFVQVQVQARGNLSVWEKDALVRRVENQVLDAPEVASVYARTMANLRGRSELPPDTIGVIQLELIEWDRRPPAAEIAQELRARTAAIPGIQLQIREQEQGPAPGKPIQLEVSGEDDEALFTAVEQIRDLMQDLGGLVDIEDTRPLPGVEWRLLVDRSAAARYGADVTLLGQVVQMVTGGVLVAEYRPDDADEEVEIRVRFPPEDRTLEELMHLRVPTPEGQVPIRNFVEFEPAPETGVITRIDGQRIVTIAADTAPGVLANDKILELRAALNAAKLPEDVGYTFAGQSEEQSEAGQFLMTALFGAVFLMFIILVTQFNSFFQATLVLSAIVFSTAGVFLGLLLAGRPFGVVMSGIGIIALAGIVVNNNIVLIDTYNDLRQHGMSQVEAALRTGAQRLRPIVLTTVTTILGLMPMVLGINIDLIGRDVAVGAPSTQWWTELSSAITGGLAFATVLTLLLTPSLLVLGDRSSRRARPGLVERLRGWRRPRTAVSDHR